MIAISYLKNAYETLKCRLSQKMQLIVQKSHHTQFEISAFLKLAATLRLSHRTSLFSLLHLLPLS